jgi:hypothetical protein
MRTQTSGAVKPPSEWPTTTTPATVAGCPYDGVGVLLPTGRPVLAREIHGDSVVPGLAQRRRNQVPSHALPPPPWMSANVATAATLPEIPRAASRLGMERLWSPVVATSGNRPQMRRAQKR